MVGRRGCNFGYAFVNLAGGGAPALPLPGGARLDRARLQEGHPHRPGQDPGEHFINYQGRDDEPHDHKRMLVRQLCTAASSLFGWVLDLM